MRQVGSTKIMSGFRSRWSAAVIAVAATVLLLPAAATPVVAAPPEASPTGVSSDGATIDARQLDALSGPSMVPATAGTIDPGADDGSRDGPINPGPSDAVGARSIIGDDQRSHETNTDWFPASAAVQLTIENGDQDAHYCSGWMISADTVATAGHCVFDVDDGGWLTDRGVRAWPGRESIDSAPFGFCEPETMYSVDFWVDDQNREYDYGAIKLDCNVGETSGTFGYRWQSDDLDETGIATRGYPQDKADGNEQWVSYDEIRDSEDRRLFYDADTVGGQSGSSVYTYRDDCNGPCTLAIHAYGTGSSSHNSGTRINEEVFNFLRAWSNE